MKRLAFLVLGGIALGIFGAVDASAQDLGYVDMERVLQDSRMGKAAQAELEKRFGDKRTPLQEEERAIRQLQQNVERDKPLMSQKQLEKKEAEIKQRIETFEKEFTAIQKQILQAQQEEGRKILPPARDAVHEVAKKKKLAIVFEASQAGLLYLDPAIDVTDSVIKAMDEKTK